MTGEATPNGQRHSLYGAMRDTRPDLIDHSYVEEAQSVFDGPPVTWRDVLPEIAERIAVYAKAGIYALLVIIAVAVTYVAVVGGVGAMVRMAL